jgi:DNA-binding LytR/AlgR family response regulator
VEMVPVSQVLYFEAADKYVRVQTAGKEYLVRTALRELLPQLDPGQFWQIHRGTVVRADAIERVVRDPDSGKLRVHLRGRAETLLVSRLHAPRFKAW